MTTNTGTVRQGIQEIEPGLITDERSLLQSRYFRVHAVLIAERLELAHWKAPSRISLGPLLIHVSGGGLAVIFRCGVLVCFQVEPEQEQRLIRSLKQVEKEPLEKSHGIVRESEELWVRIDPDGQERMSGNLVTLQVASAKRIQLVAEALCRSIVLAEFESRVAATFDRVEGLAIELQTRGATSFSARELLNLIGDSLLSEQRMVGRAEIRDKPELLWEHGHLEPIYQRLIDELEIHERHTVLERKIGLISRTATTALELLQTQRGHRLELYIVVLIVIEVVLIMYELVFR